MGAIQPSIGTQTEQTTDLLGDGEADPDGPEVWPEMDTLRKKIQLLMKKNEQLKALVTQLSVLVIRNVVDRRS